MIPEEIGCFLSHRAAWQAVAKDTEEWSFVAEDDIHFGNRANNFVSRSDWVPPDADIIKAETFRQKRHFAANAARSFDSHAIRRMTCQHSGAAGYFLSKTAASRLVHLTQNICALADSILFEPKLGIATQFNIYQIDPAICVQDQNMRNNLREGIVTTLREAIPRRPKPTGLSKLKRELQRPFIAIVSEAPLFSNLARYLYSSWTGSVFKSIPYSDD